MDESNTMRIVILGKTGTGKSSLANTIFGEEVFKINHTLNSETRKCQAETKSVNGRSVTLIDTPGFFDTDRPEEQLKPAIVRCVTECAPGPHAFLIVLKVEKFTVHEQAIINKISQYFSEEAFKYATIVFTHGDQLLEGQTIEDFVRSNKLMSDLVKKCGGRCHVIDNKYWKNNQQDEYRSNQFQVKEILKTIDKTTEANKGSCFTNEMLQAVEEEIRQEEENIRLTSGNMSEKEIRKRAKLSVFKKLLIRLAGIATGALLGALLGVVVMVGAVVTVLKTSSKPVQIRQAVAETVKVAGTAVVGVVTGKVAAAAGAIVAGEVAAAAPVATLAVGAAAMGVGAVKGGLTGYDAADRADTVQEAVMMAKEAVLNEAQSALDKVHYQWEKLSQPQLTQNPH